MSDCNDFYIMVGTITSFWLSIAVSLILIIISQFMNLKTSYIKALGIEKTNINSSFESITKDLKEIDSNRVGFSRGRATLSNDEYIIALETTCSQIDKVKKNENIAAVNLGEKSLDNTEARQIKPEEAIELIIVNIIHSIFKIIQCYPSQDELGKEFINGTKILKFDFDYQHWMTKYCECISFHYIDECFKKFEQYIENVNTELDEISKLKVTRIKNVIENLRCIDSSLQNIKIQDTYLASIIDVLNLRKKFFHGVEGLVLFGFILPAYMLLPPEYHFNHMYEWQALVGIIAGLLFLWFYTLNVLWKVITSLF